MRWGAERKDSPCGVAILKGPHAVNGDPYECSGTEGGYLATALGWKSQLSKHWMVLAAAEMPGRRASGSLQKMGDFQSHWRRGEALTSD